MIFFRRKHFMLAFCRAELGRLRSTIVIYQGQYNPSKLNKIKGTSLGCMDDDSNRIQAVVSLCYKSSSFVRLLYTNIID